MHKHRMNQNLLIDRLRCNWTSKIVLGIFAAIWTDYK